jgi:integrase
MATLRKVDQHGRDVYRLTWYDKNGDRRQIRLGEIGKKAAEAICSQVGHLVDLAASGSALDARATEWLAKIGKELADKLAGVGLIAERKSATLAAFIDAYLDSRHDLKKNSARIYRTARDSLVEYFGAERSLSDINSGEALEWRQWQVNNDFAEATISKKVKLARQFFKFAIQKGIITKNPFSEVKTGGEQNPERMFFVERSTIETVLEATTDIEWQLIIALSRWGGLRCPSETLVLKWTDIDWEKNRLTVPSSKTARYGKASRVVPLFPELRPYLEAAFENAAEGAVYCVGRYREDVTNANLRTAFLRILRRAGVKPWERLFHNMRASRQTELCNQFPSHVVADWMGNTPEVADKHCLQVTEQHFQAAQGGACGGATAVEKGGANDGAAGESKPLQIVAKCLEPNDLSEESSVHIHPFKYTRRDSNPRPLVPKTNALIR